MKEIFLCYRSSLHYKSQWLEYMQKYYSDTSRIFCEVKRHVEEIIEGTAKAFLHDKVDQFKETVFIS